MTEQQTSPINYIVKNDIPDIACLLDLLAEHPIISENPTLTGSIAIIKTQVMDIWNKLELAEI